MTASGPRISSIQKRLYTVLPRGAATAATAPSSPPAGPRMHRVRSNSASNTSSRSLYTASQSALSGLAFFDSPPPPPPSSRPGNPIVLSTPRLPIQAKAEAEAPPHPNSPSHASNSSHSSSNGGGPPPSSIALTSPHSNAPSQTPAIPSSSHHHHPPNFFPYSNLTPPGADPFDPAFDSHTPTATSKGARRTGRHRYHFDVGAYGIPKNSRNSVVSGRDGRGTAAHWNFSASGSRTTDGLDLAVQVGEDAYFVRENAMGVADGVGGWSRSKLPSRVSTDPSPSALFARRLMHFCSDEISSACSCTESTPTPPTSIYFHEPLPSTPFFPNPSNAGIAWNTPPPPVAFSDLQAVQEEDDSIDDLEDGLDVLMILERAYEQALKAHVIPPTSSSPPSGRSHTPPTTEPEPLMTGSSTALLAVLDSAPSVPLATPTPSVPVQSSSTIPATSLPPSASSTTARSDVIECDAVIKIAHLGDCMGMLVRDDEIVWRSEEMWWSFNTPLQLGPASRTPPSSAQVITLPVRADDILILASDGLSDNLWDEDVLDEVVRFKKAFLVPSSSKRSPESVESNLPSMASRTAGLLGRRTLAGMLSEALCSRARKVSEAKVAKHEVDDEVPFARRAREEGKMFRGGKTDDISVLVAVISPAES